MVANQLQKLLRPSQILLRIIWIAFTISIFMYLALAYLIIRPGTPLITLAPPLTEILRRILPAVAAFAAAASVLVRKFLLSNERISAKLPQHGNPDCLFTNPQTQQIDKQKKDLIESLSEKDKRLLNLSKFYLVPNLLCLILNETIALLGFILAIAIGTPAESLPYAAAALLLNIVMFPRLMAFIASAEKYCRL